MVKAVSSPFPYRGGRNKWSGTLIPNRIRVDETMIMVYNIARKKEREKPCNGPMEGFTASPSGRTQSRGKPVENAKTKGEKTMAKISFVGIVENGYKVFYESGAVRTYKEAPKNVLEYLERMNGTEETVEEAEEVGGLERDEGPEEEEYDSLYFKSKDAEIIYYLLEADGETRCRKLGVNLSLYQSVERAREWNYKMYRILKDSDHPKAEKAIAEAARMYEDMLPREPRIENVEEDVMDVEDFNPVREWNELNEENPVDEGFANEQLFDMLNDFFTVESLRRLISKYGMDKARRSRNWDKKKLLELIVKTVEARATQGEVFRNYEG